MAIIVLLGVAELTAGWLVSDAKAADAPSAQCHLANFRPVSNASVTYRARGNRCEGLYSSPVASNSLRLLAYQDGRSPAQPFHGTARVEVKGLAVTPSSLLLRALTTRPLTNYAMDTTAIVGGSYQWDTSVLSAPMVAMKANEIALAACSNLCIDRSDTVYYPVVLTGPNAPAAPGLRVVVQSQRELMSIAYTLTDNSGRTLNSASIVRTIPSRRPVDLPIPYIGHGVFTLRIVAAASAGSQALLTVRIAQP